MPIPANPEYCFRLLLDALIETHREIAKQARYRPRLKVPPETMRIVRRQLRDARHFRAACGAKSRTFPAVPGGTMRFSTLSLLLALTRQEFERFGKAYQYHDASTPPRRCSASTGRTNAVRTSANEFAAPSQAQRRA